MELQEIEGSSVRWNPGGLAALMDCLELRALGPKLAHLSRAARRNTTVTSEGERGWTLRERVRKLKCEVRS